MRSANIKQFGITLAAVLSLLISSIAACACSHHQAKTRGKSLSCHEHASEDIDKSSVTEDAESAAFSEAGCICLQIAPKVFGKAENVKYNKHAVVSSSVRPPTEVFISPVAAIGFVFAKPPYLADSFYNLSPGRAPPVL